MLSYRLKNENGFMGNTHALSVVAVVLSFAAFLPKIFFNDILNTKDISVLIAALIIAMGAGLLPDLDNTKSSAISTLGPIGSLLSFIMRSSSEGIYALSHTRKEPSESDPHRGFWHTAFSGIAMGIIVIFITKITTFIKFDNHSFSLSSILLFMFVLIGFELSITALLGQKVRTIKHNSFGILTLWLTGLIFTIILVSVMPQLKSYTWMGVIIIIGWLTHILGDTITTSGTPFLWPISHHGKRWWSYRLPPHIHADSEVEHKIFFPLFFIIATIAFVKLFVLGGVF